MHEWKKLQNFTFSDCNLIRKITTLCRNFVGELQEKDSIFLKSNRIYNSPIFWWKRRTITRFLTSFLPFFSYPKQDPKFKIDFSLSKKVKMLFQVKTYSKLFHQVALKLHPDPNIKRLPNIIIPILSRITQNSASCLN